jgi:hypothetical protein
MRHEPQHLHETSRKARIRRKHSRRLVGALVSVGLLAGMFVQEGASAKKPECRPRRACTSTTTTSAPTSTSTTQPTTTTTQATTTTAPTTTTTIPPGPGLLWHGDADSDMDRGDQTDCMDKETPGLPSTRLSIVNDPTGAGHGKVYQSFLTATDIAGGDNRAEWNEAFVDCDGDTEINLWGENGPGTTQVYIGWRSYLDGDPGFTGATNGGNYLQWKGNSSCGGPAVGMTINNNRLSLRTIDGDPPGTEGLWIDTVPLTDRLDEWTDFVMAVNFSKGSDGWIELWVNGQPQTMSDGTTRHEGPTVCPNDSYVYPKWGVYGFDDGAPIHLLESPKIGTTFSSVAP